MAYQRRETTSWRRNQRREISKRRQRNGVIWRSFMKINSWHHLVAPGENVTVTAKKRKSSTASAARGKR